MQKKHEEEMAAVRAECLAQLKSRTMDVGEGVVTRGRKPSHWGRKRRKRTVTPRIRRKESEKTRAKRGRA